MSDISTKLQYLNTTKGKIKDVINMTGVGITNDTFRSYAQSLYDGYINVLKDRDTLLDNMNTGTSTGTISGSANLPVYEYKASKLSTQETTTGKNLANIYNIDDISTSSYKLNIVGDTIVLKDNANVIGFTQTNKTLAELCPSLQVGDTVTLSFKNTSLSSSKDRIYLYGVNISWYLSSPTKTITQDMLNSYVVVYGGHDETAVISEFMISKTGGTYEPYTNGPSPNPSYPQEVNTVKGYRNLFDINGDVNTRYNGATGTYNTVSDNDLTTTASVQAIVPFGQKIYVGAGNSITLSGILKKITYDVEPSASNTVGVLILYNDNTTTGYKSLTFNYNEIGTRKITSFTATTDYIFVTFGRYNNSSSVTFTDIQVVIGEDKPYVPYGTNYIYTTISDGTNSRNVTIPLNDNEICGIGDYKDELIIDKNGHAKLNKKIGKVVLDGQESWATHQYGTNSYQLSNVITFNYNTSEKQIMSNCFKGVSNNDRTSGDNLIYSIDNRTFVIRNTEFASLSALQTYLSTHDVYTYSILATPTEIDLGTVDMELYDGTNNITNSEDMDMSIKYIKDTYE